MPVRRGGGRCRVAGDLHRRLAQRPGAALRARVAAPRRAAPADGAGDRRPCGRPSARDLREGADAWDAIVATAAPVMVTGTPRAAALAAIAAHEAGPRGWYGGLWSRCAATAPPGSARSCAPRRVASGVAEVRTGGDLVAGSDPAREELESRVKAVSLWRALGLAVDADLEARVPEAPRAVGGEARSICPRRWPARPTAIRSPPPSPRACAALGWRSIETATPSFSPAATTSPRARWPTRDRGLRRDRRCRGAGAARLPATRSSRRRRSTAGSSTACRSRARPRRRCGRSRPCATPRWRWPMASTRARGRRERSADAWSTWLRDAAGAARRARSRRAAGGLLPDPARVAAERSLALDLCAAIAFAADRDRGTRS